MSKPFAGSFSYFRQPKSKARWKSPAIPEFEPSWLVVLYMPGMPPDRGMRRHLPLCDDCKACPGNPVKDRPNCACIKAVERWGKEELTTRTVLLQKGKLKELQEMREPEKYATPAKVLMTYKDRGPKDAKARVNSLRCIFEQATGKDIKDLRWSDLTDDLVLGWAEMRQEAGRRDWLGPQGQRKLPENGWQLLRELRDVGNLPALDRSTPLACNTSIRSYLTQAKTIFGQESRQHILRGLRVPELEKFLSVVVPVETPKGHKSIATDRWAAMIEEADVLKEDDLPAWVVHELLLRLSCRPVEVVAARPSWLEESEHEGRKRWLIRIINRPDEGFTLKAGSGAVERAIWLTDALVAAIRQIQNDSSLIGAKHATDALKILGRHSKWMRKYVPKGSSQTNYLLRHSGAAERMTSGDSTKAAALLGHKTTAMAETTYGRVLDIQNPISDDEILRRMAA